MEAEKITILDQPGEYLSGGNGRPAEATAPELEGAGEMKASAPPEGDPAAPLAQSSGLTEAQALSILESNPLGVYVLDNQWRFQYLNKEVSEIVGRPRNELLGKNIWDEFPEIIATVFFTSFRKAIDNQQPSEFEVELARLGKWFQVSAYPYPGGLTVYFRDITERKAYEVEQQVFSSLMQSLENAGSKADMLNATQDQVTSRLHVENMAVALLNSATSELIIESGCGRGAALVGDVIQPGSGVAAQVVAEQKTYSHYDAFTDPAFADWKDLPANARAIICVPLFAREEPIGALWVEREEEFTPADIRSLEMIANLAANHIQRAAAKEHAEQRVLEFNSLHECDQSLSLCQTRQDAFSLLLEQAITLLKADAGDILLLSANRSILECAAGRGFRFETLATARTRANEGHAGRVVEQGSIVYIANLLRDHDSKARMKQMDGEDFVTYCGAPLIARGRVIGVLEIFQREATQVSAEDRELLQTLARHGATVIDSTQLALAMEEKSKELDEAVDATLEAWVHSLDLRDQETPGHTKRVIELTLRLSLEFGFGEPALTHIRRGALLHDIGKIVILDNILRKPTSLTDDEWEVMYKHPSYGYGLLSSIPFLRAARDIPYCHHERWDGSGYPRKLRGEEIPLPARIFAVVDTWDALTSDRPYRKAWPKTRARAQILEEAGWHFDPRVVDVFVKLVEGEM